jgi:hypothetical protein
MRRDSCRELLVAASDAHLRPCPDATEHEARLIAKVTGSRNVGAIYDCMGPVTRAGVDVSLLGNEPLSIAAD